MLRLVDYDDSDDETENDAANDVPQQTVCNAATSNSKSETSKPGTSTALSNIHGSQSPVFQHVRRKKAMPSKKNTVASNCSSNQLLVRKEVEPKQNLSTVTERSVREEEKRGTVQSCDHEAYHEEVDNECSTLVHSHTSASTTIVPNAKENSNNQMPGTSSIATLAEARSAQKKRKRSSAESSAKRIALSASKDHSSSNSNNNNNYNLPGAVGSSSPSIIDNEAPGPSGISVPTGTSERAKASRGEDHHRDDNVEPRNLRSRQAKKQRPTGDRGDDLHNEVRYLRGVSQILRVIENATLDDAKQIALKERIDRNYETAVIFMQCHDVVDTLDYKDMLSDNPIIEESFNEITPGVFKKERKELGFDGEGQGMITPWQVARNNLLRLDNGSTAKHPIAVAYDQGGSPEYLFQVYLDQLKDQRQANYYSANVSSVPNVTSLLRTGLDHHGSAKIRSEHASLYLPRFRIGSLMSSTAIREADMYHDALFLIRHGAPRLWVAFDRNMRSQLVQVFYDHLIEKIENVAVTCAQVLEHQVYLISCELIRQFKLPCVAFVQRPGDAAWIRTGSMYLVIDLGQNLVEWRNFTSNTYFVESLARQRPCRCEESEALSLVITHTANTTVKVQKRGAVQCRLCNVAKFKTIAKCQEHLQEMHGAHYYLCEECGCDFKRSSTLDRHMQSHLGIKVKCKECGKMVADLRSHKTNHKPPKTCKKCFKIISHRHFNHHKCRV